MMELIIFILVVITFLLGAITDQLRMVNKRLLESKSTLKYWAKRLDRKLK